MRASPWRSLARLPPLAVFVVAACSPNIDLSGRPPPCAPGNHLCMATGVCVEDLAGSTSASPDAGDAGAATAAPMVGNCLFGYTVRQGGTISIPVPFVHDLGTVTSTAMSPDLTITPVLGQDKTITVNVAARHAAAMGQTQVMITTSSLGPGSDRQILVFVSPITATPRANGGDDSNPGSSDSPFLTFQQAAKVAAEGDTIFLRGLGPFGPPAEKDFVGAEPVTLPSGVTVSSPTAATRSSLHMPIVLAGDATLDDLDIEDTRLLISTPSSDVELRGGTIVGSGITIAASATASILHITNGGKDVGEVRNDVPSMSSLLIAADRASVTIENGGAVRSDSSMAAIHSDGAAAVINIHGGAVIENSAGGPALELVKLKILDVDTVTFRGSVAISDPTSAATFTNSEFELAESTGEIVFSGMSLDVENSTFAGLAVVQNNAMGRAKLRNSRIAGYTQAGYRLIAGFLDAGTLTEPGNNTFADYLYVNSLPNSIPPQPAALSIEVLDPPADGKVATSSASTFNGMQPGTCTASQDMALPGIVTIMPPDVGPWVFVDFY